MTCTRCLSGRHPCLERGCDCNICGRAPAPSTASKPTTHRRIRTGSGFTGHKRTWGTPGNHALKVDAAQVLDLMRMIRNYQTTGTLEVPRAEATHE